MGNFWEEKALSELSDEEWESLCDNCGKCCLHKLQNDEDEIFQTNVVCSIYDFKKNCCSNYSMRNILVPDCVKLDKNNVHEINWMPKTCAYRLLVEGKPLPDWHPLISKDKDSVVKATQNIAHRCIKEDEIDDILENHIVEWEDF